MNEIRVNFVSRLSSLLVLSWPFSTPNCISTPQQTLKAKKKHWRSLQIGQAPSGSLFQVDGSPFRLDGFMGVTIESRNVVIV
jgi:hypothetical protein